MQDKYDKAFEDRAWADMQRRLDEAMPVPPAPSRIDRRPWLLALILLLAVGGYLLFRPAAGRLPEQQAKVESSLPGDETTPEKAIAPEAAQPALPEAQEGATAESGPPPFRDKPVTASRASGSANERASLPSGEIKEEASEPQARAAQSVRSTVESKAASVESSPDAARRSRDIGPPAIGLPVLPAPLHEDDFRGLPLDREVEGVRGPARVRWAVGAGLLLADPLRPSGFQLDLQGAYRLGGGRWSIEFGLGYRLLDQDLQPPSSNVSVDESVNLPNLGSGVFDPARAQAVLHSYTVRRHVLYAPLILRYRLGSRWSLAAGAQAVYTLSAHTRSAYDQASAEADLDQFDSYTQRFIQAAAGGSIREDILNNWDIGMQAGIRYRLLPDLAVELEYIHGMNDLVPNERLELFNRTVEAGVVYRFR